MNVRSQQGGILLYAILTILLLSSAALMLQSYLLPALMTGTEVINTAQGEYLVESYKNILRQRIGKNANAASLRSALLALDNKTISIPGPNGTPLGTVTAKFTVAWFQTANKQVTVLPTDELSWKPETGTYQMLAITSAGEVSRFDYKFDNNGKDNTTQIPAYASIYFRCARTNQTKPFALSSPTADTPSTLTLPSDLSSPFTQFSKVLPSSNMLIGFMRESSNIVSAQDRNKHDYNILCGTAGKNGFYDVMTIFEKTNGDLKNYELFLGQHVEAKLTVTPAGSAPFSRVWNFNGRTKFKSSNKTVVEADGAAIKDNLSQSFATEKNNEKHFSTTGVMTTDSTYGSALKLSSSDKQPIHGNFLYNLTNGANDTGINYARLALKDAILISGAGLNTTMKMAYRPLYSTSDTQFYKHNYCAGFIPRMKISQKGNNNSNNPHAWGEGIAVGILGGSIPLWYSQSGKTSTYTAINGTYPIDLAILGFTPFTNSNNKRFSYSFSGPWEQRPAPLKSGNFSLEDVDNNTKILVIRPCIIVWYFNDNSDNTQPGQLELLAIGSLPATSDYLQPIGAVPGYLLALSGEYIGLHVNIQETVSGYNDLRVMIAKPDLTTPRWLSMDADMQEEFRNFLWNTGTQSDTDSRCKISWTIFDNSKTRLVENPLYDGDDTRSQSERLSMLKNYDLTQLQKTDEPQYVLRTSRAVGSEFTNGGIYASTTPSATGGACGLLRDFGLAIQQVGNSATATDITYPTVSF